jgi:hypothetical protein
MTMPVPRLAMMIPAVIASEPPVIASGAKQSSVRADPVWIASPFGFALTMPVPHLAMMMPAPRLTKTTFSFSILHYPFSQRGASSLHTPRIFHLQFSIIHSRSALDCFTLRVRNDDARPTPRNDDARPAPRKNDILHLPFSIFHSCEACAPSKSGNHENFFKKTKKNAKNERFLLTKVFGCGIKDVRF